jgi:hypothetical protein
VGVVVLLFSNAMGAHGEASRDRPLTQYPVAIAPARNSLSPKCGRSPAAGWPHH